MENNEKQIKEEPKNPQQVEIESAAGILSEAELDKAAAGAATAGFLKASSRIGD